MYQLSCSVLNKVRRVIDYYISCNVYIHHRVAVTFECYNMFIIEPLKAAPKNNVDGPNEDLNFFLENLEPL